MSLFSLNLDSKILYGPVQVNIALPNVPHGCSPSEFYSSSRKFRVLWLLHGSCSDCNSWFLNTNIYRYAIERELAIVSPTVLNSDYSNYATFADGFAVWDFFSKELMPLVHGWLPVSPLQQDNFIAGLSMGGNGALMLASSLPERFAAVAVLSSTAREVEYLRPFATMNSYEFRKAAADRTRFPGPNGTGMRLKEINAIAKYDTVQDYLDSPENAWDRMTESIQKGTMPRMYVSCGTSDKNVYPRFLRFREYVKKLGFDAFFEELSGYGHEYSLWDLAIQRALDFFEGCLKANPIYL